MSEEAEFFGEDEFTCQAITHKSMSLSTLSCPAHSFVRVLFSFGLLFHFSVSLSLSLYLSGWQDIVRSLQPALFPEQEQPLTYRCFVVIVAAVYRLWARIDGRTDVRKRIIVSVFMANIINQYQEGQNT